MHVKRVCKDFEIENLGEYLDLYLKTDTLLLADDFEYFRKTGLEIYQLAPVTLLIDMLIINVWKIMIRVKNCHILNFGM